MSNLKYLYMFLTETGINYASKSYQFRRKKQNTIKLPKSDNFDFFKLKIRNLNRQKKNASYRSVFYRVLISKKATTPENSQLFGKT